MPRLLPGLSADEEAALARRIEAHDMAAKCAVVEANLPLVEPVAKRYVGRGLPLAELIQDGSLGLIRAVETYDYRRGAGFSTFARLCIRQAITGAITDQTGTIHVPRQVRDTLAALQRTRRAVASELDAPPAGDEREWRLGDLGQDEQAIDLLEAVGESLQAVELQQVMGALTPRERRVIVQRFGLKGGRPRTLDEIGRTFGLSRERTRRIETKALVALRSCRDSQRLREFLY